jgi:hypothetical protein
MVSPRAAQASREVGGLLRASGRPTQTPPGDYLSRSNHSRRICSLQAVRNRCRDGITGGIFRRILYEDKILFKGKRITKPTTMTYECVL